MISVTVAVALADRQEVVQLEIQEGCTVGDALIRCGLQPRFHEMDFARARVGIWGRSCDAATPLRDGDRVEVYRPLRADPKEMRLRRARLKPSP